MTNHINSLPSSVRFSEFLSEFSYDDHMTVLKYCMSEAMKDSQAKDWVANLLLASITQKSSDLAGAAWGENISSLEPRTGCLLNLAAAIQIHYEADAWKSCWDYNLIDFESLKSLFLQIRLVLVGIGVENN